MENLLEEEVIFLSDVNEKKTGYEKYKEEFEKCFNDYKKSTCEEEKSKIINKVIDIYYKEKIFPMLYLPRKDIEKDIVNLSKKRVVITNNILNTKINAGNRACKNVVKNIYKAKGTGRGTNGELSTFISRKLLYRTIKFVMKNNAVPTPTAVRGAFALTSGSVQNFLPIRAKAIYEHFTKDGDVVYDFSAGFGGRMIGAICSDRDITYIGIEPNSETYVNLNKLKDIAEEVLNKQGKIKLYKNVSEEFELPEESVDFAFSSPPYFNVEIYTDEETQCYNRFKEYESWLNGYVYPTMINIKRALKTGGKVAVNVANSKKYNIFDDWKTICEDIGLQYVDTIYFQLSGDNLEQRKKSEGIMIFEKK